MLVQGAVQGVNGSAEMQIVRRVKRRRDAFCGRREKNDGGGGDGGGGGGGGGGG